MQSIDWNDWTSREEADARIACAIGWRPHPKNPGLWVEGPKDDFTGYYVHRGDVRQGMQEPRWAPTGDAELALAAAGMMARTRRVLFTLTRTTDGQWRAAFVVGGRVGDVSASSDLPSRAICEAILRLEGVPDPESLFRGRG